MKKLSKEEIGTLGLYEFQGYIGSMTSPTFGGWKGTDRLIELMDINGVEKPKILEVGCSTGYITRYVAKLFDCEIIGVDLSKLLLDIAEEESGKLNLNNISFKHANVENLPFPNNTFDIVYGEAITALVSDPLKVLKEYDRVLKPGGKIATLDLFMKESLSDEFVEETNEMMSHVIGAQIKIRTLQEWEGIFTESGFGGIRIYDYYEDLFKRQYSFGEMVKITYRLLCHMMLNKKVRQKIVPPLKFAKKFQKAMKGNNYGFLIFTGVK
ncbi:methyltransferase domain-containing protein [Chloroflexota bacterium]